MNQRDIDDYKLTVDVLLESNRLLTLENNTLQEKLKITTRALKKIQTSPFNITEEGIKIFHIADDALDKIEKIK